MVRLDLTETYSTTASPVEETPHSSTISTQQPRPTTSGSLQLILTTCMITRCQLVMPTFRLYWWGLVLSVVHLRTRCLGPASSRLLGLSSISGGTNMIRVRTSSTA